MALKEEKMGEGCLALCSFSSHLPLPGLRAKALLLHYPLSASPSIQLLIASGCSKLLALPTQVWEAPGLSFLGPPTDSEFMGKNRM